MQKFSDQELESKFAELVKTERKITYDILLYIQEIDIRSLHLALGYSSLAEYLIKKHHYSEGSAFRRISAMRMLKAVPEMKQKIVEGSLNLSQLSMAQTAVVKKQKAHAMTVSNEDKRELLLKIENQSMAKTQSCLMDTLNIDLQEKKQITYGKEESVYLNLKLTKEEFAKLKECLALMSHQAINYKELFIVFAEKFLKSKHQSSKMQGNFAAKSQYAKQRQDHKAHKNRVRTRFIPIALKKEVFKRDEWRCQFKAPDSHICGSKQFIQIHHLQAFAKGGSNKIDNLSLRCRSHNRYEAQQEGLFYKKEI